MIDGDIFWGTVFGIFMLWWILTGFLIAVHSIFQKDRFINDILRVINVLKFETYGDVCLFIPKAVLSIFIICFFTFLSCDML